MIRLRHLWSCCSRTLRHSYALITPNGFVGWTSLCPQEGYCLVTALLPWGWLRMNCKSRRQSIPLQDAPRALLLMVFAKAIWMSMRDVDNIVYRPANGQVSVFILSQQTSCELTDSLGMQGLVVLNSGVRATTWMRIISSHFLHDVQWKYIECVTHPEIHHRYPLIDWFWCRRIAAVHPRKNKSAAFGYPLPVWAPIHWTKTANVEWFLDAGGLLFNEVIPSLWITVCKFVKSFHLCEVLRDAASFLVLNSTDGALRHGVRSVLKFLFVNKCSRGVGSEHDQVSSL